MSKLNKGIILEECLFSFLIISTYLLLMSNYMIAIYQLKQEIADSQEQINELKSCMLSECELSAGNSVRKHCQTITIKTRRENVCVQI